MNTDLYICSKPLQYFNIRNIQSTQDDTRQILAILGFFTDSYFFFHRVKELDHRWNKVLYFKTQYELDYYLLFHPVHRLFVEIDNSFIYGLFHKLHRFNEMYMFEEGFGSYRRDRFDNSTGLKYLINRYTGVGKQVGFSSFLTGQYLYLPDLYKQLFPHYTKELHTFKKPFLSHLKGELSYFMQISRGFEEFLSLKSKRIGIYLTNHHINKNILHKIKQDRNQFDSIYIKPHPHICDYHILESSNIEIIRSNIMIEFLLILLLENGNQLTLYHENSTAVIWFQHEIINHNLGKPFKEYDTVSSFIYNQHY